MALVGHARRCRPLFHGFLNAAFLVVLCGFFVLFFLTARTPPPSPVAGVLRLGRGGAAIEGGGCDGLEGLEGNEAKCSYLSTGNPCVSQGYIDYLRLFYCHYGRVPPLGYVLLGLWLLVLFYLLGNTASEYFCPSLEGLSRMLRLSPAVAGATLLSLGNGAPDVFASVVSFTASGDGTGKVGLSSVLGGAFFVSSVVVGVISISVGRSSGGGGTAIDKPCFVRDVCFLIAALGSLLAILVTGKITLWGAIAFISLYIIYVIVVSATHCCRDTYRDLSIPLLDVMEAEDAMPTSKEDLEGRGDQEPPQSMPQVEASESLGHVRWWFSLLTMPLYLPRRLTIPLVSEERWSKPFAVVSVTTAPTLLVALWAPQREGMSSTVKLVLHLSAASLGIALGITALETTKSSGPPKRLLLPWLAGGFLMSVIWTYIIAQELVALLVSIGYILGVSPSILGLTVLAWGNSIGDMTANVAMAVNGGPHGAQVAISGCYAGPTFNTLVGLGVSLVWSSWAAHPSPFVIPTDPSFYQTLGFLGAGLLWALVILPRRGMRLDRVLGIGLLAIYVCFLSLRISESLGWLLLHVS